jgi:hypothetical protein
LRVTADTLPFSKVYSTDVLSPSAPEGAISQAVKENAKSAANPAKIIFFIKNSVSLFFEGHTVLLF